MIVRGYKLNGYNATYEKVALDVRYSKNASKNRVLEVTDINAGISYTFEADKIFEQNKPYSKAKNKGCKV